MVYNREEIAQRALASKTCVPNTCQLWSRTMAGALSVGDFDGDGAADAEDGWKQSTHKHPGDRKPPRGTLVAWLGGSNDNGHRAISLGPINNVFMVRSTDAPTKGRIGTVPLDWFEKNWGLTYAGWSEDASGILIPLPPAPNAPKPPKKRSRGAAVDKALDELKQTRGGGDRGILLNQAKEALKAVPFID